MKTIKLLIVLIITSFIVVNCSRKESKYRTEELLVLKFVDVKTSTPLIDFEIGIPANEGDKDVKEQSIYNGHSKFYYNSYYTDDTGEINIPQKKLSEKYVNHIFIPSTKTSIKLLKKGNNELIAPIYRCGFGYSQRIGESHYNLANKRSWKIDLLKRDTIIVNKNIFELAICPDKIRNKSRLFLDTLDTDYYLSNQNDLWELTWKHFKNEIGDDLDLNPNSEIWFQHVIGVMSHFGVENLYLSPLIEEVKDRKEPKEKYNFLIALFKIRYHHISKNLAANAIEEKKIKALFEDFYSVNTEFIEKVKLHKPYKDFLMRKLKQSESFYNHEGNMINHPNSYKRIRILK